MARITSARDRSKGKAKTPVTSTKGRQNRQSVSQAKVTRSGQSQGTGTARVTRSKGPRGVGNAVKLPNRTNPSQLQNKAKGLDFLREQGGAQNSRSARQTRAAYEASKQSSASRGGQLAKRGNSRPETTSGPVQQVQVRDLGSRQPNQMRGRSTQRMSGSGNQGRLSPGQNRNGNAGASAVSKAKGGMRGNIATALAAAAGDMVVAPLAYKAGQALGNNVLRPVGRALDDRMKGVNSRDEAQRMARRQPLPQMSAAQRANSVRLTTDPNDPRGSARGMAAPSAPKLPPPTGGRASSSARTAASANAGRRTSTSESTANRSMASRTGGNTPSQAKPSMPGRKWDEFNPNRGTSESNNPMLDRGGGYLRAKMAAREAKGTVTGAGPVANSEGYQSLLRIEKNKKKKSA